MSAIYVRITQVGDYVEGKQVQQLILVIGLSCERPLWCPMWNPALTKSCKFGWRTGGSIIFWPCACWIFKKILGNILSVILEGQSSFDHAHVQCLKKTRRDPGLSYLEGKSSFDHAHVECLKNNSRRDPGLTYLGGQSSFDHVHVESLKKI